MTPFFERAIHQIIFDNEGEAFTNDPDDRGGATKYGITLQTLSKYRGVECTSDDVKNLKLPEAKKIYEVAYWQKMNLSRLQDNKLAFILLDQGINSGTGTAIRMLQTVLNEKFGERLAVDGILGNQTDGAVKRACNYLRHDLVKAFQIRYARICVRDARQLKFLVGWLNRTHRYLI